MNKSVGCLLRYRELQMLLFARVMLLAMRLLVALVRRSACKYRPILQNCGAWQSTKTAKLTVYLSARKG
jgi:hypothetical protein